MAYKSKYIRVVGKKEDGSNYENRRRFGGNTQYAIQDHIINQELIENDHNFKTEGLKPLEKIQEQVQEIDSELLTTQNISSSTDDKQQKTIDLCKKIGELFDIDVQSFGTGMLQDEGSSYARYILKSLNNIHNQSPHDFVKNAVEKFRLKDLLCDSLRNLHEAIASSYWEIMCQYKNVFPKKITFGMDKEFPANYTKIMTNI